MRMLNDEQSSVNIESVRAPWNRDGEIARVKWLTQIAAILAVAAIYALAAALGLKLAVASGNVSPVWPATGFAIAAVYLGGYRLAIGVWLGGLVSELLTGAKAPVG